MIYKVTCKLTNKIYVGNTQQFFKMRMKGHFQDIKRLVKKGVHSDLYARHFAGTVPRGAAAPTPGMQRDLIKCEIIWQGNPISVVKTFGKSTCALCNRERMEIVKNYPKKSPILLSILVRKFTGPVATGPSSIGFMNRTPPVLMSVKIAKRSTWKPLTRSNENSTTL